MSVLRASVSPLSQQQRGEWLESMPSRDTLPLSCSPQSHRLLQLNMKPSVRPSWF